MNFWMVVESRMELVGHHRITARTTRSLGVGFTPGTPLFARCLLGYSARAIGGKELVTMRVVARLRYCGLPIGWIVDPTGDCFGKGLPTETFQ
jgi:hypothetical protein